MARILIAYATTDGQTEKIADFLADQLNQFGHSVTRGQFSKAEPVPPPQGYDAVLLGSPVRFDKYNADFARYVDTHLDALKQTKTVAFFSVSGVAASSRQAVRDKASDYMAGFEQAHRWKPHLEANFAGAIKYTQYNPLLRWVMKRISKSTGRDTDTSRDWEYTDWQKVASFAGEVNDMLGQA